MMMDKDDILLEQTNYSTERFRRDATNSNPQYTTSSVNESVQVHTQTKLMDLEDFDKKFCPEQRRTRCRI
jgi:hypothetical protein